MREASVPVYVEEREARGQLQYLVSLLFDPGISTTHAKLDVALQRLRQEVESHLRGRARQSRHDELAATLFAPDVADDFLTFRLALRRSTPTLRLLLVSWKAFGTHVAFSPSLPQLWFTVERGERIRDRAREVFTAHYWDQEARGGEISSPMGVKRDAWITYESVIVIDQQVVAGEASAARRTGFPGSGRMDGEAELRRVGRCLDDRFPNDLDRALGRDDEVSALAQALDDPANRQPVLLVGRSGVGKTALVHELVFRRNTERAKGRPSRRGRGRIWLLSPQRLISGMSYVGQWQERVLAISRQVHAMQDILFFDDLPGLFQAGISAQNSLSVAHMVRPRIERGELRVVAEITPEAFGVLQELDRGFADMFQVVRLEEPSEVENIRIQVQVQRGLETRHRCRFMLDALPTVLELTRAFVRDRARPGNAASLLAAVASRHVDGYINRHDVLDAFAARTGLPADFLDEHARLTREDVVRGLRARLIGQDAAVQALADAVLVGAARMNDTSRPLATLLFLGPTGVGKTECAKSAARYLFGDAERLLRFDMNEYVEPGAASRLVGTFARPDGMLTSAIRRQPFAVVLLDEIEKAHSEVFDLLLQLMGEGRLSDGRGRTADFSNAIVILTSNLGVREAQSSLGFGQSPDGRESVYRRAAERFFRPEFFNRIDRVLPFDPLSRDDIREIARLALVAVLDREGLTRRKCVVDIDPEAVEQIVADGYDPALGARALKRAVEGMVTEPAARTLVEAGAPSGKPNVVFVAPGPSGTSVRISEMATVELDPRAERLWSRVAEAPEALIEELREKIDHLDALTLERRPEGPLVSGAISPRQEAYFAAREQLRRTRALLDRVSDSSSRETRRVSLASPRDPAGYLGWGVRKGQQLDVRALWAVDDLRAYLREMAEAQAASRSERTESVHQLLRETALLATAADADSADAGMMLLVRGSYGSRLALLEHDLRSALELSPWITVTEPEFPGTPSWARVLEVRGLGATLLLAGELGTHLVYGGIFLGDRIVATHLVGCPLREDRQACLQELLDRCDPERAADGPEWGPVVRITDRLGATMDLATGQATGFGSGDEIYYRWMLDGLAVRQLGLV